MEEKGGIYAVALSPTGPVQNDGGEQENGAESEEGGVPFGLEMPDQPKPAPGQQYVEENGEEFDPI